VLFVAPFPPRVNGMHGGSRVIAQMVTGLAARHNVGLIYLQGRDDAEPDEPVLRACSFVHAVPRPRKGEALGRQARIGLWLATGQPVWVADWWTREFASRLRAVAASWDPDVVQIEFHVMAQYVDALSDCPAPRVLTEHEAGVLAIDDERRFRGGAARLALALDHRAWRRYERRILNRVDSVAVFSERDCKALSMLVAPNRMCRIPMGVTIPTAPLEVTDADASVLFVGSFRHRPNIDAAIRLARDIHPRVQMHYPGARLTVVGEDPPERLLAFARDGIVIAGGVTDVTPYMERATLVAAPIRFGGGVRIKVLEAMAAGKAVVASPVAATELAGDHLAVAESDDDFAREILRLLREPDQREALAQAGRQWVTEHASTRLMVQALDAIHDSLLAQRVPKGGECSSEPGQYYRGHCHAGPSASAQTMPGSVGGTSR
jgi:glycosyltransferase involved in cell wall biosynthesis